MKRLFIASRGNPEQMAEMFRKELPDFDVFTQQPAADDAPVPYIVVGRPSPGVVSSVPGLKLVLSLNAGIEHLLASGEVPSHIPIVRLVDDGLAEGMSDWVLAHALAWHRNLAAYRDLQSRRQWSPLKEKLARERIVTILGAGALGGLAASHFVRFGFETRVWSRSGRVVEGATSLAGKNKLIEAASNADILVNLLPLTAETADIVDGTLLDALAPGALFINGARGGHVVDADLIVRLDSGQLSSAALDVFRTEPLPADDPLWSHPKVLLSPHVAAPTHAHIAVAEMAANIRRFENGEPIPHLVDRTLGY